MNYARTPSKSIAVVGNDPALEGCAAEIDACDMVVRFNAASGFESSAGRRVTHLALVNRGGQSQDWVENDGLSGMAALRETPEVIFPFPPLPDGPDGLCWTRQMTMLLSPLNIRPRALGEEVHDEARSALTKFGAQGRINPSTGFLVTFDLIRSGRFERPKIFGFGFAGWEGHPWAAERAWFNHQHERGHLYLHGTN